MKNHLLKLSLGLTCLVIIICFSSCSTALMKASPFYTGQIIAGHTSKGKMVRWDDPEAVKVEKIFANDIKAKMDDERIYVWPIFFKNYLLYSFLWPLAELNDVGWDVRPFVSVDNYEQEYRILTGGWNNKDKSSYIFPLYVKNSDSFYSLPYTRWDDGKYRIDNYLFLSGYFSRDNSSYLFPLYYYDGTNSNLYTLICSFTKDFGYVLPLYLYDTDHSKNGKTTTHLLLPPLGTASYFAGEDESYWKEASFFPLFFYERYNRSDRYRNPKYEGKKIKYKDRPADFWLTEKSVSKEWTVLPLAYFSENEIRKESESVIFPFYFAGKDNYKERDEEWLTLFPFYFSGYDKSYQGQKNARDEEWLAIIPFFAYGKDGKDSFSNFMMFAGTIGKYINDKPYDSSYILPVYYYGYDEVNHSSVNPKYKDKEIDWRKRPKDYYIRESTIAKNSFYFPSIFTEHYENNAYDSVIGFPFYFQGFDKRYNYDEEWLNIFPFYFSNRNKENVYKNYGIVTGTRDEKLMGKNYSSSYVIPFYNYDYTEIHNSTVNPIYEGKTFKSGKRPRDYYIDNNSIARENFYFPSIFTEKYENGEYEDLTVFPFYYKGFDKRYSKDKEWNSTFPVFFYERDKKDISKNYLCFMGTSSKNIADRQYDSSYVLPLYYYGYSKDYENRINPKYEGKKFKYHERPKDFYETTETVRKNTYIFPNYFAEENEEKGESEFTFFPFVFHEKNKRFEETGTPFSVYHRKKWFDNDNLTSQFLLFFYYYDRDQYDVTEYVFPSYYSYEDRKAKHKITNFFPFTFQETTEDMDSFGTLLWLYTSRHNLQEKKSERQALWYLYYNEYYEENKKAKTEEYESSRVLWKAYHRETKGDTTNIDVFPFVSYSKNTERSKFSFAWRFFSVENSKKATKVHLLFIPVWW